MTVLDFGAAHLKQERARQTRAQILLAAARTFEHVGYTAARLEEIGGDAGVTKGALYFHFASKADLAKAVIDAHFARWHEIEDEHRDLDVDPLTKVVALSFAVAQNFRSSVIARAGVRLGNEYLLIDTELAPPFVFWIQQLTNLVRAAQKSGDVPDELDAASTARIIVSCYFGLQEVSSRTTEGKDLVRRVREWWHLFLPAIATRRGAAPKILEKFTDRGALRAAAGS